MAVDEVAAVGWHIQPGDHVDVLGTVEMPVQMMSILWWWSECTYFGCREGSASDQERDKR